MRKLHKELISNIVGSLNEASAEIQKLYFNKDIPLLTAFLADCAENVVQLCDFIAQHEGEGTKTILYLKEYCEIINRVADDSDSGYEHIKRLKKKIAVIENSVRNDIKTDRFEVVFFPYKASMWDTFESIWLTAKDDPQCDAYVVPIPYYDKNPDASFGQRHYEGGQYPDYVPVTDWMNYNTEERRPDIIFIHNPYDSYNHMTSVHPDYYAERLSKLTDTLVYLPYFVAGGDNFNESFCDIPGTLYAHKVIVQSYRIRQLYLNNFKKFEKEPQSKSKYNISEKKFLALGSPKFDAVINKKREDFTVPDEWAGLIKDKKVILYNTSISSILSSDEQLLLKLRSVFDSLKEHEDIVLWWRPHPLSRVAYSSMRSHLHDEYEQIITEYKHSGFGIYDDTEDLHRAIVWSDAYYGDVGSLMPIYAMTGKPLMLQNIGIVPNYDKDGLPAETFFDDGNNYWFTVCKSHSLFKMSKQTFEIENMGAFPNESYKKHLFARIEAVGERLYFIPHEAEETGVYNTATNRFEKAPIAKSSLSALSADYKIDVAACRQASRDIVNLIDRDKIFYKNTKVIESQAECIYRDFSFMGLPEYIRFINSDNNEEYKQALRKKQIEVSKYIAENTDGFCGKKVYERLKEETMK